MTSNKKAPPQPTTAGISAGALDDEHVLPPKPSQGQKRTRTPATSDSTPSPSASPQQLPPRPRRSWTRRSASWTNEEDEMLVQLVKKETAVPPSITASKTWSRVAAQLKNRTGKQCRERYLNQLRPGIRRDPWSPEEERILHDVHARIGNKWVAIAEQLPGRTDNCVKNHWNSMLRKRQRREAALRAAEKNLSAVASKPEDLAQPQTPTAPSIASLSPTSPGVPSALSSPLFGIDIDRNSDADFSSRTGYATPSGLSSILDVSSSSGIPSPFTASSPITPKRDVKLQISSLVVGPSNNGCDPGEGYFSKEELTCAQGISLTNVRDGGCSLEKPDDTLPSSPGDTRTGESAPATSEGPDAAATMANAYHTPVSCKTDPKTITVGSRILRRSSRLAPGNDKSSVAEVSNSISESTKQRRNSLQKMRKINENVGNPLAALAIAASSVPPSPLTPVSRFSVTSRNRSASPLSRSNQASESEGTKAKCSTPGSNVTNHPCDEAERISSDVQAVSGPDVGPIRKSRRLEKSATIASPASISDLGHRCNDSS